jgi:hypothetical protein
MNQQSKEQLCDSNNTDSTPVLAETPNVQQIHEEKPFYLTNQEELKNVHLEDLNTKKNKQRSNCDTINLFFLYIGIIGALAFTFSLFILGKETEEFIKKYSTLICVIGAIGSIIFALPFLFDDFHNSKCTEIQCYVIMIIFTVFWISFVGFLSLKLQGAIYFILILIMSNAFINCIITMANTDYVDNLVYRALGDLTITIVGCFLFIILGRKFESIFELIFLLLWIGARIFVFRNLEKLYRLHNAPLLVMSYYAFLVKYMAIIVCLIIYVIISTESDKKSDSNFSD